MASNLKVLRIGIIQGGKIVEERLLKSRVPVTIGTSPKNTIVIPQSNLPPSFVVFPMHGESYALAFTERMDGRIQGSQGSVDFGALISQGLAKKQGENYVVALHEEQRGKVALGEVTLLWQFVAPPPEAPKPVLPDAAKGSVFRSLDKVFTGILVVSLGLHLSAYVALARVPPQDEITLEEIPDRFAKLLVPDKKPEPVKPKEEQKAEGGGEAKKEAKKAGSEKKEKPAGPPSPEHKAAVAAAVAKRGLVGVLGTTFGGAGGGVADVFGNGAGIGDVSTALAGAGGVALATEPGAPGGRKGAGGPGSAAIGGLATGGGGGDRVGFGGHSDVRVRSSVAMEDAEMDSPDIDQNKLGAFVRARQGGIKACYDMQLKRNPNLKGKIVIQFTILETGALSDLSAVLNTVGASEVASCIMATMRAWRTPFKPSSPVTVQFPFVFTAN